MDHDASIAIRAGIACACLLALASASSPPPLLQASDLLAAELLEGPLHRVRPEVPVVGYMGRLTIEAELGDVQVDSAEMARVRIAELGAVVRLRERTSGDAFAEALGESAADKVRAVERTVTDPVGTATSIGRGVGRLFGRARRAVEERLADGEEDEEHEDEARAGGPGPETSGAPPDGEEARPEGVTDADGEPEIAPGEERSTPDRAGDAAGSLARWYFGYDSAVRRIAAAVGADPYTTNPLLRDELDRLARAAAAGGQVLRFFVPYIPAVSEAGRLGSLSWTLSREGLEERNRTALLGMGVDEGVVRRLLANDEAYSPTVQTALVLALESLEGLESPGALVETATTATTEVAARMYVGSAHLLVAAREAGRPLQRGRGHGRALAAELDGGGLVVAAAVDYLPWDADVAAAALSEERFPRELWITGVASDEADARLRSAGWILRERVPVTIPWPATSDER